MYYCKTCQKYLAGLPHEHKVCPPVSFPPTKRLEKVRDVGVFDVLIRANDGHEILVDKTTGITLRNSASGHYTQRFESPLGTLISSSVHGWYLLAENPFLLEHPELIE